VGKGVYTMYRRHKHTWSAFLSHFKVKGNDTSNGRVRGEEGTISESTLVCKAETHLHLPSHQLIPKGVDLLDNLDIRDS
jgi:hypothetical protein